MHRALAETIECITQGIDRSNRPEDRALAEKYLAALAPLLARATLGNDILRELSTMDRLFGQTWIIDVEPFKEAFAKWAAFKSEYTAWAMSGMTVNERLSAVGKLDAFDAARRSRDRNQVRALLAGVLVDETSIKRILEEL